MGENKKQKNKKIIEDKMILQEESSFLVKEDYATLRTNISFSLPGEGGKCIAITSSSQGEGKSTTSINLAISYAQLGKKVLLIDTDMRLPTIASRLHIKEDEKQKSGLSHLLIGECTEEEAVHRLEEDQIYVITAGRIPADPTRLLSSVEMESLLKRLKESYDIVILDCPPINVVVDACLMASYVDGYVLVVKHEQAEYRGVSSMINQIKRANGNILGFAYTNVPLEEKRYGGYRYGYGSYGKS